MSNIALFASGSGTNAENIINYFVNHKINSNFIIFTENPQAYVIERAKSLGVEYVIFSMEELKLGRVLSLLTEKAVDFIVLAGFLKLIPENIIQKYSNRIVNIHPALLPKYGGKGMYGDRVHRAVIDSKDTISGITIHFVNSQYDEGDIIFQAQCKISTEETAVTLAKKIHELEYKHYPEVIHKLTTSSTLHQK